MERGAASGRVRDPGFIQATISLRKLLGNTTEVEAMKKVLAEFVVGVFRAAG